MGWAGATSLFDGAVQVTLDLLAPLYADRVPPVVVRAVVEKMYQDVDWADWDTQDESEFFEDHLVHVMYELGEIPPDYYEQFID